MLIKLGNKSVPLAVVECDRESRAHHLGPYHGAHNQVACMCRSEGIPMGVARRAVPYETFYLYPLHRTDPARHALGCPHRTVESGSHRAETLPLIEVGEGFVNINLNVPLFRANSNGRPEQFETGNVSDDTRRRLRGELITLLEVLWAEAELNIWHRGFTGRRSYNVVRERLVKAAGKLQVRGKDLAPRLYVPPAFREEIAETIEEELSRFFQMLVDPAGKRWYGFFVGLPRRIEETDDGAVAIHFAHTRMRLWSRPERWQRIRAKWFPHDSTTSEMQARVVLAHVFLRNGRKPWLAIEELAVMEIADTRCWIPVSSDHERRLVQHLVENGRRFRKPLAAEFEEGGLHPDLILEDRDDRMHLEVLGTPAKSVGVARWAEKRAAYAALGQAVWAWSPDVEPNLSALPPPTSEKLR